MCRETWHNVIAEMHFIYNRSYNPNARIDYVPGVEQLTKSNPFCDDMIAIRPHNSLNLIHVYGFCDNHSGSILLQPPVSYAMR
jgi:hypothetical protein